MTRETKVGVLVTCSFLSLLGVVLVSKLNGNTKEGADGTTEEVTVADSTAGKTTPPPETIPPTTGAGQLEALRTTPDLKQVGAVGDATGLGGSQSSATQPIALPPEATPPKLQPKQPVSPLQMPPEAGASSTVQLPPTNSLTLPGGNQSSTTTTGSTETGARTNTSGQGSGTFLLTEAPPPEPANGSLLGGGSKSSATTGTSGSGGTSMPTPDSLNVKLPPSVASTAGPTAASGSSSAGSGTFTLAEAPLPASPAPAPVASQQTPIKAELPSLPPASATITLNNTPSQAGPNTNSERFPKLAAPPPPEPTPVVTVPMTLNTGSGNSAQRATPSTTLEDRTNSKSRPVNAELSSSNPVVMLPARASEAPGAAARPAPLAPPADVEVFDETRTMAQAGESFRSISARAYGGAENYAEALLWYNRNHPLAGDGIRQEPPSLAGQAIFIPVDRRVLEKRYPNLISGVAPSGTTGSHGATAPAAGARYPTYRVVKTDGETMLSIAQQTLGNGYRWKEISMLNPDLPTEFAVQAGKVLRLPPDARVEARNAAP